jgi:hypothetical protein
MFVNLTANNETIWCWWIDFKQRKNFKPEKGVRCSERSKFPRDCVDLHVCISIRIEATISRSTGGRKEERKKTVKINELTSALNFNDSMRREETVRKDD